MKSKDSLIIIDDLDIILEWIPRSFSNKCLQVIKTILGTIVNDGKITVILNCTNYESLNELYLFDRVNQTNDLNIKKISPFGVDIASGISQYDDLDFMDK